MEKTQIRILGLPIFEKRSGEVSSFSNPDQWLMDALNQTQNTFSGVKVNSDTALKISTVWACVRIISNTVAQTPIGSFEKEKSGNRKARKQDAAHQLLAKEPNEMMGPFRFKQVITAHAVLTGNGYAIIHKNPGAKPIELELVENPLSVTPFKYKRRIYYKITGPDGRDLPYPSDEIFHIAGPGFNGIEGKSVIQIARESIGSALAMQEYGGKVFATGGSKRVAITSPKELSDKAKTNIRESWTEKHGTVANSHNVAFLEGGLGIEQVGMNPEDAQFIASMQHSVNDIARFFGLITDLLATDKQATYGSAEQRAIDFIKYSMNPWYKTWEEETDRKLYKKTEKQNCYSKFNTNALLRGDQAARAKFYKDLTYIGVLSRNEIRAKEEMNSIDNGEEFYLPVNMVPATKLGEAYDKKNSNEQK